MPRALLRRLPIVTSVITPQLSNIASAFSRKRLSNISRIKYIGAGHTCMSAPLNRQASTSTGKETPYSSRDEAEVKKFDAYGASWWDQSRRSGAGPLHSMNSVRVPYIVEACGEVGATDLKGLHVLDVGCGGGILSEALARLGARVTGIDPAEQNIEVARQHAAIDPGTREIRYEAVTAEQMLASGRRFDAVVASEVIEHVESPRDFVATLAGLVAQSPEDTGSKEGHVILTTVNRTIKSYIFAIVGAEYVTRLLPIGTHQWSKFVQPQELAHYARIAGLQVKDVSGTAYNPINNTWTLKPDAPDVNYAFHASVTRQ